MRISVSPPGTGTIAVRCISAVQRQSGRSVEPATSRRSNFDMTPPFPGERSNALPCARNHDHHGNHNDLANRTCRHGRCRSWSGYGPCGCRSCRCGCGRGCWGCVWSAILGTANWPLLDRQQFPSPLLVSSASLTNDPVRRPRSRAADCGEYRQGAGSCWQKPRARLAPPWSVAFRSALYWPALSSSLANR
jgi:hypothetical protein